MPQRCPRCAEREPACRRRASGGYAEISARSRLSALELGPREHGVAPGAGFVAGVLPRWVNNALIKHSTPRDIWLLTAAVFHAYRPTPGRTPTGLRRSACLPARAGQFSFSAGQ